jgi:hypothetical protein
MLSTDGVNVITQKSSSEFLLFFTNLNVQKHFIFTAIL